MTRTRAREKVKGIVSVNSDGVYVRSTFSRHEEAAKLASIVHVLSEKSRSIVRDLYPTNNMTFLRFRLRRHEIMVAPGKNFYLIVQQGIEED